MLKVKNMTAWVFVFLFCLPAAYAADQNVGAMEIPMDNPVDSPANRLTERLASMQTMRGNFDQKIYDTDGTLLQQASGEFTVKRPRQLLWKTLEPYQHRVITDGEVLWIYDIDLEQATRKPFTEDLDQAPALLLSGETTGLQKQYAIIELPTKDGESYQLTPRGEDGVFRSMTMAFTGDIPVSLVLVDHLGQRTDIQFSDVTLNVDVPASLFQFSPPDDIDVIINEQ